MMLPQLVVCADDDWILNQFRELATDRRWLFRELRQPAAVADRITESRPTVLVLQVDPRSDTIEVLQVVASTTRTRPDVASIVICETKLADEERLLWTARVMDLGTSYVLFPPHVRSILDSLVDGLMAARIRTVPGSSERISTLGLTEASIDLAKLEVDDG